MAHQSNLTIVTAMFDLGRGNLPKDNFGRTFDHYKECFSRLLKLKHLSMVIFCEQSLEDFIWQYRDKENTRLVFKTLDDLRKFPFYNEVQTIRQKPEWLNQSGWLADSTQARLELYNPLVLSKQFFLNDAALYNFFNSNYFFWIDGGISNSVSIEGYMDENFEGRLIKHLNKMQYVSFPYQNDAPEVHGFTKSKLNELAGTVTEYVTRGGLFGGPKHLIHEINDIYYNYLHDTIKQGYMGTEETIFTLINYKHPSKCNNYMLTWAENGGVWKFFHDLSQEPVRNKNVARLAFYALTYNAPPQFRAFAEAMKTSLAEKYDSYKKYAINNSDNPRHDEDYRKLFEEFGFEELKQEKNMGINGGRQVAAEHFDASEHEYYVFFEDDMMLCDRSYENKTCKSGFRRWFPNLFENAIGVLDFEGLGFLKLCFSEVFGDQHENWAWYNLPPPDKERLFPDRGDGVDKKKTTIFRTGTYGGVMPYAVGEYFYCNWPLLFNKEGNKKVFIDVKWEHKHEQTWMSYVYRDLVVPRKLTVGTILGSPIEHNRIQFYDKRKENEHYH